MRDPNKTQAQHEAELAALCWRVAELETPCAAVAQNSLVSFRASVLCAQRARGISVPQRDSSLRSE
jgi:hypothetical protein